jgi:WD40 repeat protein
MRKVAHPTAGAGLKAMSEASETRRACRHAAGAMAMLWLAVATSGCGRGLQIDPGRTVDAAGGDAADAAGPTDAAGPGVTTDAAPSGAPLTAVLAAGAVCGTIGNGGVRAVAAARAAALAAVGYGNGEVALIDPAKGTVLRMVASGSASPVAAPVSALAFSPDGTVLAGGRGDGAITLWRTADGQPLATPPAHVGPVTTLAFSGDGADLLTGSADQILRRVRAADGVAVWTRTTDTGIDVLRFLPDGQTVLQAGQSITFRNARDGSVLRETAFLPYSRVTDVSPDGTLLAGYLRTYEQAGMRSHVTLWRTADFMPVWTALEMPELAMEPAVFSADGARLAAFVPRGGPVRVLRASDGGVLASSVTAVTSALAFAAQAGTVIAGDHAGAVHLLSAANGGESGSLAAPPGHSAPVFQVAFSPDGQLFGSSSYGPTGEQDAADVSLRVWRAAEGAPLYTAPGIGTKGAQAFAFSPDGSLVAGVGSDGRVHLLASADGHELRAFGDSILSVAFAPDGTAVVAGNSTPGARALRRFRVADGSELVGLGSLEMQVVAIAFSPDGKRIATGLGIAPVSGSAVMWDAGDGSRLWQAGLPLVAAAGGSLAFSPDGRRLMTTGLFGEAGVADVLDAADGHPIATLRPPVDHQGRPGSVSFSHTGTLVAFGSGGRFSGVHLFRTTDWSYAGTLPGPDLAVAFSPTEDRLIGGGNDRVVRSYCGVAPHAP